VLELVFEAVHIGSIEDDTLPFAYSSEPEISSLDLELCSLLTKGGFREDNHGGCDSAAFGLLNGRPHCRGTTPLKTPPNDFYALTPTSIYGRWLISCPGAILTNLEALEGEEEMHLTL
jgi:hypothetical protein